MQAAQQAQRIAELEQELLRVHEESTQGKMALDVLNEGLRVGELQQNPDGTISTSKRKSDLANVITNLEEL